MSTRLNLVMATQNFRGGLQDENKVEEVRLQMRRQGIDVVAGQESGLIQAGVSKRWDTGEVLISCGKEGPRRAKASSCFFLSKNMAEAWVSGGSELKNYGNRLSILTIPLRKRKLLLINSHFPESSSHKKAQLVAYRTKIELILRKVHKSCLLYTSDAADE